MLVHHSDTHRGRSGYRSGCGGRAGSRKIEGRPARAPFCVVWSSTESSIAKLRQALLDRATEETAVHSAELVGIREGRKIEADGDATERENELFEDHVG